MKIVEHDILDILKKALINILNERNADGNWGDVRCSTLALWAIRTILKFDGKGKLRKVKKEITRVNNWLIEETREEEDGNFSLESEAWDTSLAIIALSYDNKYKKNISSARNWLMNISGDNGVWYDEIWESTLTIVAFLRSYKIKGIDKDIKWLMRALSWINSIPSKADGEFVCPHYTGFLVWLLGEIQHSPIYSKISKSYETYKNFYEKSQLAYKWLFSKLDHKRNLWSEHTFSNSYITLGFFSPKIIPFSDEINRKKCINNIVNWFKRNQRHNGSFEDIEDTSLAILALCQLVERDSDIRKYIECNLTNSLMINKIKRKTCFLGYSSLAKNVAKEIEKYVESNFDIDVKRWEDYFTIGRQLFEEIKDTCENSHLSIFILTKDEKMESSVNMLPRDNVILEVGYFMARRGDDRTLLIVEDGTKLPSDIDGIIHIPMKNRNNLKNVKKLLGKKIKDALYYVRSIK